MKNYNYKLITGSENDYLVFHSIKSDNILLDLINTIYNLKKVNSIGVKTEKEKYYGFYNIKVNDNKVLVYWINGYNVYTLNTNTNQYELSDSLKESNKDIVLDYVHKFVYMN